MLAHSEVTLPLSHKTGKVESPKSGRTDPNRHFSIAALQDYDSPDAYQDALCREVRKRPKGQRQVVLFVHGYNNEFQQGLFRAVQTKHDFGYPEVLSHFSWPSAGITFGYEYDKDSVFLSRTALEQHIRITRAPCVEELLIVGHSIGGLLVVETLRQVALTAPQDVDRLFGTVVLISPDIDLDLFKMQAAEIGRMPQPFVIFGSQKDRALGLSAKLTGKQARLGNISTVEMIGDVEVTFFDVTEFSQGGMNHFVVGTSPAAISLISKLADPKSRFDQRTGLLPGVAMRVRKATEVILSPL